MSRTTRTLKSLAVVSLVSITLPIRAAAFEGSWQVGINAGLSFLSPGTAGSDFAFADDQSTAVGAYVGLDIFPIISAELAFTDLGEAALSEGQSTDFQAISLGATVYFLGAKQARRRSDGVSTYARLGFSSINTESDIAPDESGNISFMVGVGIQYPFADNWGVRAELTSFDADAQALLAGVFWRTGTSSRRENSQVVAQGRPPGGSFESTDPESSAQQNSTTTPIQAEPTAPVAPRVQSADGADSTCPPEAAAKIADPQVCALLSGVLSGVEFIGNTAELEPASSATLDRVVAAILDYPAIEVEIRAHTEFLSTPEAEVQLASLRAREVARYLVQNGVPVSQLRATAFGATQPLTGIANAEEQSVNSRIELRVL
ncbi:OmpA family protein [bacterium]|nr:OmpA family protein [bacterium]